MQITSRALAEVEGQRQESTRILCCTSLTIANGCRVERKPIRPMASDPAEARMDLIVHVTDRCFPCFIDVGMSQRRICVGGLFLLQFSLLTAAQPRSPRGARAAPTSDLRVAFLFVEEQVVLGKVRWPSPAQSLRRRIDSLHK